MSAVLHQGDCLAAMRAMPADSVDSVVTDPPYHLLSTVERFAKTGGADRTIPVKPHQFQRLSKGFMGKEWDGGDIAFRPETWAEVLRVLKPGGHMVAFAGSKGSHRMACAIEDAGFELRDTLMWLYGTGFPKSHDVSKGIDKALGAQRTERAGVKPGHENFVGRDNMKALRESGSLSGEGGFSRPWMHDPEKVEDAHWSFAPATPEAARWQGWGTALKPAYEPIVLARKPLVGTVAANVLAHGTGALNIDASRVPAETRLHVVSDRRLEHNTYSPGLGGSKAVGTTDLGRWPANVLHDGSDEVVGAFPGEAERFFYSAKAGAADRAGSKHPTVKPIALMRWLCRLVTPPGGVVLDPFAGSGTTGAAALAEGFRAVLCEREAEYAADIRRRLGLDVPAPSDDQLLEMWA